MTSRTRWVLGGAVAAILIVALWAVLGTVYLFRARGEALEGLHLLESLREATDVTTLVEAEARQQVTADLRSAADQFIRANDTINTIWLTPIRLTPYASTQLDSVDALSQAAAQASTTLASTVEELEPLFDDSGFSVERLASIMPLVHETTSEAAGELLDLDLGPTGGLIGSLAEARARFELEISRPTELLQTAATVTGGLDALLNGDNRYLVIAANNAEMRASSGMYLMLGPVDFVDGVLSMGEFIHTSDLLVPPGAVEIADADYRENWGWMHPEEDWRNLAASPRFPVSANIGADMWRVLTGDVVAGIIVIDSVALRDLLAVIGPVEANGVILDASNVVDYITYEQYAINNREERVAQLRAIVSSVLAALFTRDIDAIDLARGLEAAADGRHLVSWSNQTRQQDAWDALGVDGDIDRSSLALAMVNLGSNKLDPFLDIAASMSADISDDSIEVTIITQLTNSTPGDIYPLATGAGIPGLPARAYSGFLTFTVPGFAADLAMDEAADVRIEGTDGPTQVIGAWIELWPGQSTELTLTFTVPSDHPIITLEPGARVPPTAWVVGPETYTDAVSHEIDLLALTDR